MWNAGAISTVVVIVVFVYFVGTGGVLNLNGGFSFRC